MFVLQVPLSPTKQLKPLSRLISSCVRFLKLSIESFERYILLHFSTAKVLIIGGKTKKITKIVVYCIKKCIFVDCKGHCAPKKGNIN